MSATVVTDVDDHVARSAEVLARAVAGLVLDGISASLSLGIPEDDDDA